MLYLVLFAAVLLLAALIREYTSANLIYFSDKKHTTPGKLPDYTKKVRAAEYGFTTLQQRVDV